MVAPAPAFSTPSATVTTGDPYTVLDLDISSLDGFDADDLTDLEDYDQRRRRRDHGYDGCGLAVSEP